MTQLKRSTIETLDTPYESDLSAWAAEQAARLRAGAWSRLDVANLAEEIEALSRSERHALTSARRVILLHLLKWDHQPARRTRSWVGSIEAQRFVVEDRLEDSPSLRGQLAELMPRAYRRARIEAAGEMDCPVASLPAECPYTFDEIMTRPVPWPSATEEA